MANEYSKSYNSFSGIDISAVFKDVTIGSLQGISYSITREKAPIYTMGSSDPRAFARGKRGIAGTLVFSMFDSHAVLEAMQAEVFWADRSDLRPGALAPNIGSGSLATQTGGGLGSVADDPGANVLGQGGQEAAIASVAGDKALAAPWYTDQIPPFDVTLSAANEYGASSVMKIYGIEILNEGYGISIDDIVSEQQFTYVCRGISPWTVVRPQETVGA